VNSGAPAARNTAFSQAQGEYIQWLDADDLLHPDKIRLQLQGAESGVTARTLLTCSWGKFFVRPEKAEFRPDPLWQDLDPIDWIVTKFRDNAWMNPAVWLVSRRLTEAAGPWDSALARSGDDDGEYICRVVGHADHVRFVPEAKCYYRIGTPGSLNWNMETNEQALESLLVSLETSVRHLLSLEDSERTRSASLELLKTFSHYFYGSDERYYQALAAFAYELGGALPRPGVSWKYRPLEWLLGPLVTRKTMANWRGSKLLLRRAIDAHLARRGNEFTN
jgi:glycosyltransferase involved in cell wall biosynthesis